ncbi:MAG: segregation/condensation protein A [Phycisphaerales bacterium]
MADYRVNLDIFAGPLDLLLYLVRKEEVDIYDIPIAKITVQYLQYVDIIKQFDIDLAGDFLVMAATLMEIKSAMLLPREETEQTGQENPNDPRAELIRQLLEYKRFKDAANLLDAAAERHGERFGRPTNLIERLVPDAEPEIDMDQVSIWDLLEAFDTICKATGTSSYTGHIRDDTPIDLYQIEVLSRLQSEGPLTFARIFEARPNRLVMVGIFLAVLELIRDKLIWAEQDESSSQIFLRSLTDEPAEEAVSKAIMAVGEAEAQAQQPEAQAEAETEAASTPPIPIVEAPAKARPQAELDDEEFEDDESDGEELDIGEGLDPGETDDEAPADDDLILDEP